MLYPDLFNNCFFPETLNAALELLEHYEYAVVIPPGHAPAVRPPIDYGMLDYAKKQILKAVDLLRPYVRQGVPVVFLEPSEAAVFRDELPDLMPQHLDGHRLTELTFLLAEFMERQKLEPPPLAGKVIFQAHCHERAVLNSAAGRSVLARMGMQIEEPQTGCCGMAGSFGFEKSKYDISLKIVEQGLLPAIKKQDLRTYIVADGFSCRTQIMDVSGRKALHSADIIHLALRKQAIEPKNGSSNNTEQRSN